MATTTDRPRMLKEHFFAQVVRNEFSLPVEVVMRHVSGRVGPEIIVHTRPMPGKLREYHLEHQILAEDIATLASNDLLYKIAQNMGQELFWSIARRATERDELHESAWACVRLAWKIMRGRIKK